MNNTRTACTIAVSVLLAARGIYEKAGYKLVKTEKQHSFGHNLTVETLELDLSHGLND